MSTVPCADLKPHGDSGRASLAMVRRRYARTRAKNFPTIEIKARIVSSVCLITFLENGDNQRNMLILK